MARYMQVLSRPFCERNATRTINIHHSFLPAFEGARPYHRAHERGVKIIGATAHYATADLGASPVMNISPLLIGSYARAIHSPSCRRGAYH